MGLWDKIKSATNFITGGSAKISLVVIEPKLGVPFMIKVTAIIADANLNAKKVYLKVKSVEEIELKDVEVNTEGIDSKKMTINHSQTEELFQKEFVVAEALSLVAKETYIWEKEISLPEDAQPTFEGKLTKHSWKFLAALDVAGNDPDSGWVSIDIR